MAEGDGTLYRSFKAALMTKDHDLGNGGDTLKVTLHTAYTPSQAHEDWADVSATEYSGGVGYTAGGKTLGSQTVSIDTSAHRGEFDGADVAWTSLGPLTPATPSDAILWNDTPDAPLTDPLIGFWELGTTATNGGDYTLQWSTSPSAIILLT
ncbi:MAG: hypothetical protein GQ524_11315 [Anaerolineales bacterium]|nr:hypothetical protein [Anaerolineales bacterium]